MFVYYNFDKMSVEIQNYLLPWYSFTSTELCSRCRLVWFIIIWIEFMLANFDLVFRSLSNALFPCLRIFLDIFLFDFSWSESLKWHFVCSKYSIMPYNTIATVAIQSVFIFWVLKIELYMSLVNVLTFVLHEFYFY